MFPFLSNDINYSLKINSRGFFANYIVFMIVKKIIFFDNLYIIIKLITVFIRYEYKVIIKQ